MFKMGKERRLIEANARAGEEKIRKRSEDQKEPEFRRISTEIQKALTENYREMWKGDRGVVVPIRFSSDIDWFSTRIEILERLECLLIEAGWRVIVRYGTVMGVDDEIDIM